MKTTKKEINEELLHTRAKDSIHIISFSQYGKASTLRSLRVVYQYTVLQKMKKGINFIRK